MTNRIFYLGFQEWNNYHVQLTQNVSVSSVLVKSDVSILRRHLHADNEPLILENPEFFRKYERNVDPV